MTDDLESKVKQANKMFYDIVGSAYEAIDGRRSGDLITYVSNTLNMIAGLKASPSILDLGCGSGFVSRIACRTFKSVYSMDLSFNIIRAIPDKNLNKITADSDSIPIKSGRLDCVAAFAVLHHCFTHRKMISEIYRILDKGGIFYSDHDMDALFFHRFKRLLRAYRKLNNARRHYLARFSRLTGELYDFSEFHQEGIPTGEIEHILRSIGFSQIDIQYHWYGLSSVTNKIFGDRVYRKGYAPLVKIIAVK